MKALTLTLLVLSVFPAGSALAHGRDALPATVHFDGCDEPARFADRYDVRDARLAVHTEDGGATLLLTDEVVAIQLSDRMLRQVKRELRDEQDDEDNAIARAFMAAVFSGVRSMLDHSAECRIRDLRDVEYRNGRLVIRTRDGERLFDGLDINDRDVMASFSEEDALRFVREFRRVKQRQR
jgi:hypothetical protein